MGTHEMTPEEALVETRKLDKTEGVTFAYLTTLDNGHIHIKAVYPNPRPRHIGQGEMNYVFDSKTGKLIRRYGGK